VISGRRSLIISAMLSVAAGLAASPMQVRSAPVRADHDAPLAVVGGFLLDGYGGPPIHDAVVVIEGDRIVAAGSATNVKVPTAARVIDANGYTVMPGLIDAHVHLDILGHGDYPTWHDMVRADYAEVMERSAAQLLAHGVTTARDAGGELGASVRVRDRIARGEIVGPRMLVSGGWIQNWTEERARANYRRFNLNARTVEDAARAAAQLFDGGADFIKAYTGLTLEQMRAITSEAHRRGKRVGAHVYTDEEIRIAVEGGADLLDHAGSGHQNPLYTDDTLRLMASRQIPIAQSIAHRVTLYPEHLAWPERIHDQDLKQELGRFAEPIAGSLAHLPSLSYFSQIQLQTRVAPAAARQLAAAGCRIILGTDSGTPGYFHSEAVWREADALVNMAGLSPMDTIVAATRLTAQALGVNTGVIAPGRLADVILVRGNPLISMRALARVETVIKDGVVYTPNQIRGRK
jgi:imidazolonepropionase-like amidohydrolase